MTQQISSYFSLKSPFDTSYVIVQNKAQKWDCQSFNGLAKSNLETYKWRNNLSLVLHEKNWFVINYEEGNWVPFPGWFYPARPPIQFLQSRNTRTHVDIDLRIIGDLIEHNNKYSGSESLKD